MERVLNKLDQIEARLDTMNETLIKQEENLRLHMYRTDLAERAIKGNSDKIKPLEDQAASIRFAVHVAKWAVGIVVGGAGLAASIVKILEFLHH